MRTLFILAVLAVSLVDASAQAIPMHHRHSESPQLGNRTASVYYRLDDGVTVRYHLGFTNAGLSEVELLWLVSVKTSKYPSTFTQRFSTSYKPLAVIPEAGLSKQLFVMGWVERTSELVIERWRMQGEYVRTTPVPDEGPAIDFKRPRLVREELYRGEGGYAWGCVFHPYSRDLIALVEDPSGSGTTLMSFDVDTPGATPELLFDEADVPFLRDASGISLAAEEATEAVFVFLWDNPAWQPQAPQHLFTSQPRKPATTPSPYRAHLLIDRTGDARFETSYEDDYSSIEALRYRTGDLLYEAHDP